MIKIRYCKVADKDHACSIRQYAHTYHYKNNICVTRKWEALPLNHKMGLVAHEMGHILADRPNHTEATADKLGNEFFGIRIRYKDSKHGKRLQYLSKADVYKVYKWAIDNIILS